MANQSYPSDYLPGSDISSTNVFLQSNPAPSVLPKIDTPKTSSTPSSDGWMTRENRQAAKATEAKIAAAEKERSETPLSTPPDLKPAPKSDDYQTDPMKTFGSAAMVLATLGSLMTRRPLTSALNAGAALNHAVAENDASRFKSAFQTWKAETDNAWKMADWQHQHYDDIMKKIDKGEEGAEEELRLKAVEFQDPTLEHATKLGEYQNAMLGRQKALLEYQTSKRDLTAYNDAIQGGIDDFKAKNKKPDGTPYQDSEIPKTIMANIVLKAQSDMKQAQLGKYGDDKNKPKLSEVDARHIAGRMFLDPTAAQRALGYGDSVDKTYVDHIFGQMQEELKLSDADIVAMQAGAKASANAISNVTKQYSLIASFEETMENNIKIAEKLATKGQGTEAGPVINRWIQAGRVATGDPDVKAFNDAVKTVASEYAKISTGATGAAAASDTATARSDEMISNLDTPESLHNVFHEALLPEARNRTQSLANMLESLKSNIRTGGKTDIGGSDKPGRSKASAIKIEPGTQFEENLFYENSDGQVGMYTGEKNGQHVFE